MLGSPDIGPIIFSRMAFGKQVAAGQFLSEDQLPLLPSGSV